jgi:hypothetical protein
MQTKAIFTAFILSAALTLSACAGYSPYTDPYFNTKVGAATGAVAGAALGYKVDDDKGPYVGAASGALLGGAVGNYMDRQRGGYQQGSYEQGDNYPRDYNYDPNYPNYDERYSDRRYRYNQGYNATSGAQPYRGYSGY